VSFLEHLLPACPIRALFGIPCPGCGLTRAVILCLHGDWATSLHAHPLAPIVLVQAVVLSFVWFIVRAEPMHLVRLKRVAKVSSRLDTVGLLIVWVYRVSTGVIT